MKIQAATRLGAQQQIRAERIQEYIKRLRKLGIKSMGSGSFADVFQHPTMPNVVVKLLTDHDRGYEAYVKFSQKNPSNKYCPRILDVVRVDGAFDKVGEFDMLDLRLVAMEKLKPLEDDDYHKFGNHVLKCAGLPSERDAGHELEYIEVWRKATKQKTDPDLAKLAAFIVKNVSHRGVQLDMHQGNMMMRGGQIIVTDPFATYD